MRSVQRDKNVSTDRTFLQIISSPSENARHVLYFGPSEVSQLNVSRYLILLLLGIENEPPTSKELENVRQRAISKLQELGSSNILTDDLERLRSSDEYVTRFVV